ncbi:hypothetical protein K4F52_004121 [Lecanicillium sp. MT-2017a]|nr:hypothetical protein K4F52_004121 [Lecanicillium sp. MT-2017a]
MPPPDAHTNLEGILNRMFSKDNALRNDVENGLLHWDRCSGILTQFMQQYSRCKPLVHAEVQVLEYFYTEGLQFAGNDRYVACSKPSCFCCRLYFKYHPSRMVMPAESHQNVWPNWGIPKIEGFNKADVASNRQRDIMNQIIQQCREEIIFQVLQRATPIAWHPDSQTAISDVPLPFENALLHDTKSVDAKFEEGYESEEGGVLL